MIIFDAHCDTVTEIEKSKQSLYRNNHHVDICRMQKYKGFVQMFALWIAPQYYCAPLKRAMLLLENLHAQIKTYNQHITLVTNYNEACTALKHKKIAAFISIEGGEALEKDLNTLEKLYHLGVRSICLTWNNQNALGASAVCKNARQGLTDFGKKVVREMNRLKMLVDVSHLSAAGFWDVLTVTTQPIIASHSNAKNICPHLRNLSNDQFKAIVKNKGMVGINFYTSFLTTNEVATVLDIVKHIEHYMALGGENHIGLGCDYDGMDHLPKGIEGIEHIETVLNTLLKSNYTEKQVKKIAGNNFIKFIKKNL